MPVPKKIPPVYEQKSGLKKALLWRLTCRKAKEDLREASDWSEVEAFKAGLQSDLPPWGVS